MNSFFRAVTAEALKLRGTLALRMCLIAPLVVVALYVLQLTFMDFKPRTVAAGVDGGALAWRGFLQTVLVLWAILMLPLLITLQSALLAGLEHGERIWKHLLVLPLPHSRHYLAKWVALAALVLLANLVLVVLAPLGGWLLTWTQPAFGISGAPPWAFLLGKAGLIVAAAMPLVALHTWLAVRWPSFTIAVATGMSATVMGSLIGQSARFGPWFPWTLPMSTLAGQDGSHLPRLMLYAAAVTVIVTLIGLWDFRRREFA